MAINRKQVKFLEFVLIREKVVKALATEIDVDIWDQDIADIEKATSIDQIIIACESLEFWPHREAIAQWIASLSNPTLR